MRRVLLSVALVVATVVGIKAQPGGGMMFGGFQQPDVKFNDYIEAPVGYDVEKSNVEHGTIQVLEYKSTTVGTNRLVTVYLPPKYDASKKYPVLYLLHGIGGDHQEWMQGVPNVIMDNLYSQNRAVPMIIVIRDGKGRLQLVDIKNRPRDEAV